VPRDGRLEKNLPLLGERAWVRGNGAFEFQDGVKSNIEVHGQGKLFGN
jgi:hypothetical protein